MIRDPSRIDALDARKLLRKLLRAEAGLGASRPAPRAWSTDPPPAPKYAEDVLVALAATYKPGDPVGLQQIVDAIAVTWEQARTVRQWAQRVGAWPYTAPGPAWVMARRPKGGAP